MAKSAINKTFKISAKGILAINGDVLSIENTENGTQVLLSELFSEFNSKTVSININYDEEY